MNNKVITNLETAIAVFEQRAAQLNSTEARPLAARCADVLLACHWRFSAQLASEYGSGIFDRWSQTSLQSVLTESASLFGWRPYDRLFAPAQVGDWDFEIMGFGQDSGSACFAHLHSDKALLTARFRRQIQEHRL